MTDEAKVRFGAGLCWDQMFGDPYGAVAPNALRDLVESPAPEDDGERPVWRKIRFKDDR